MKRIKNIILSAMLALTAFSFSAYAEANVSYYDFSSDELENWKFYDGAYAINDGVLELSPGGLHHLNFPNPRPSGTVVLEYDAKINDAGYFQVWPLQQGDVQVCNIIAGYGNKIRVKHGTQGSTKTEDVTLATNVAKNKWYHFKHVISCSAAEMNTAGGTTSSVYVYDENGTLLNSLEDMYYVNNTTKSSTDSLAAIRFQSINGEACQIDNLVVYESTDESIWKINELACKVSDADAIKGDVALFGGYGGANVSWKSSNTMVVANDGKVTRAREEMKVTLTATISYKELTKTIQFPLTVCPLEGEFPANVSYTDFSSDELTNWKLVDGAYTVKDGVIELSPNANLHYLNLPKPQPRGNIVVEYDVKRNDKNYVTIYLQAPNGASVCRMVVGYGEKLRLQHGTVGSDTTVPIDIASAAQNEWYHIKHVLNCRPADKNTADGTTSSVYVYDKNGELIGYAEDKYYMQNVKFDSNEELSAIGIQFAANNTGTVQLDNIAVYESTPASILEINKLSCAIPGASGVSEDIVLKTKGYGDAQISWKSSNPESITDDGKVTIGDSIKNVDMTATISYGGEIETVIIPVTVLSKAEQSVNADIYSFDFNDNAIFTGLKLNNTDGYVGVRNNRLEMEKPAGTEVTINPQAVFDLNKMEYGDFYGEAIIEFDFVSTADAAAICYVQVSPDEGSVVRIAQRNEKYLRVVTGGTGETAETTNTDITFVPGNEYHAKIIVNYDNNKCSVYINGEPVAENHNFMYPAPGFLRAILCQLNGKRGAVAIDNMVIYNSDAHSSIIATEALLDVETTITEDVVLPTEGCNGATIIWTSAYENLLTSEGKLLETPKSTMEFDMTATITKDGYKLIKPFTVTVPTVEEPEKLTASDAAITNDFFGNISALKAGYPAKAKVNVTKPRNSEASLGLIAALYDKEGTLKSVTWTDKALNAARVTDSISVDITDAKDADDYVILYVWDSISGMIPVKAEQTVEIE